MYTIQQILSLSTSISKITQPHNNLINFSNSLVKKEFEVWSDILLNSITKEALLNSMSNIFFILNRLPNFEYMLLSRQIDEIYPRVLCNSIICNTENIKDEEYRFFIHRLCKFRDNSLLLNLYNPLRAKLAEEFLKNMKLLEPAKILEVSDDEIIFCFKDIIKDWQNDATVIFFEDEVKPEIPKLNREKIYLRKFLK